MRDLIPPNGWKKIDKQHSDDQFQLSAALAEARAERDRFAARLQRYDAIIDAQPLTRPTPADFALGSLPLKRYWRAFGKFLLAEQLRKARQE